MTARSDPPGPGRPGLPARGPRLVRFGTCARGAAAVEFALLAWPMVGLVLGILQFVMIQYTQVLLNDRLHVSAAIPEAELLAGDQAGYKTRLCERIVVVVMATCQASLLVELAPLSATPTAETAVAGTTFAPGSKNDVMLLRASLPVTVFVPFIPRVAARSSVVFRRT
ncbi:TadE/TadG family type IV pilus assembly protein [Methylobacterium planeticum]|uniref:Pilus assembly protein n=1 Tax=Methylobacterium planeticum TaxID=2615211 RepID=A0A6N6MRG7_9HYPH|nr:TadE/TadG family type IV pilus assembly protein [Methylobacterium planeticum]KAB1072842.1 pilus assembly protein [Methylobacterium planeticum]